MDRLQSLRAFQKVVDEGGFAAAARALDMAPAGVTRLVADLEEHLGTRLLQRTTRRVSLTDAGDALLKRSRHILQDVDEAFAVTQSHTSELSGVLRVLAPPVLAVNIVAPLVAGFRAQYPRITIDLHVETAYELSVEDHDITLVGSTDQLGEQVVARHVASSEAVVCASASYIAQHGAPQTPEDLALHQCLRLRTPGARLAPWRLMHPLEGDRVVEQEVSPAFLADHTDTLLRATLEGAGISSQPIELIAEHLCNGDLVRVLSPWITARLELYAALPSRKFMPARSRAFLDHLVTQMRQRIALAQKLGCGEG
ncbi:MULTISPECIES: LysR family transcriptional regulator [Hydrogenophaga]|uniref:LysR family transcriptional regulator n=2 Tax=Hydrogenophaga TaxID=47420 RepID=A0ABW2QF68_9BURK